MSSKILCADIGGSHITAAIVDIDKKIIIADTVVRQHVHAHASADIIIKEWCTVLRKVIQDNSLESDTLRIGLAMPGPFDYESGISYIKGLNKYESLYGLNVKERIADQLGISVESIRLKNDAAAFLHGEVLAGAAQGYDHAIGFTLGTGIGTARYHLGVAEDADLWRLPYRDNVSEEYLATRWFLKRYHELTGSSVKDVKELVAYSTSHPAVAQIFSEFSQQLADFLQSFIKMDDPQVIIMGGNISRASDLFLRQLTINLEQRGCRTPILHALLGEEAAMLGAACSWLDLQ